MRRSFKYRLFTNANQERELSIALESHRRLYNQCLDYRELAWETVKVSVGFYDCARWFTQQRKTNPWYARINAQSAQATLWRLNRTFDNFFRYKETGEKCKRPRFKSRGDFNSIEFPQPPRGAKITGNRLRIHGIGTIRIKLHRPIEGTIKTVILKREVEKWFVVVSCILPDIPIESNGRQDVGIDVGLTNFLTTSDGPVEPNPRYLKTVLPALRIAQRSIARKKNGGSNRRKAVRVVQKIYAKVRNCRREHHYQVAIRLVLAYGLIAVERLNIQGMLKNYRLARAISDAAWGGFLSILKSKAESAGCQVVEVDPRGTSQECSSCGCNVPKDLSVRRHDCPYCGLSLDRDHNAALNILARARLVRIAPVGDNVGPAVKRPPRSRRICTVV